MSQQNLALTSHFLDKDALKRKIVFLSSGQFEETKSVPFSTKGLL